MLHLGRSSLAPHCSDGPTQRLAKSGRGGGPEMVRELLDWLAPPTDHPGRTRNYRRLI
jgi:hypothetical protein